MKFGKEIARLCKEQPRHRHFYLNYKELKGAVKLVRGPRTKDATRDTRNDSSELGEAEFCQLLSHQLEKVNNFVKLQQQVMSVEQKRRLRDAQGDDVEALDRLADSIVLLDTFVRKNFVGFQKITKKCDKHHGTTLSSWFLPRVATAAFRQCDFNMLLLQLGQLYAKWRSSQGADSYSALQGSTSKSPETFLVPEDSVMRLKVALLKLVGSESLGLGEQLSPRREALPGRSSQAGSPSPSLCQASTQVYFDNSAGSQYKMRYQHRTGQEAGTEELGQDLVFRYRWQGECVGNEDADVYLDVEGLGAKSAAVLKISHLGPLSSGQLDAAVAIKDAPSADAAGTRQTLELVQAVIKFAALQPVLSVNFSRTSFGGPSGPESQGTLATLDEKIAFVDESKTAEGPWRTRAVVPPEICATFSNAVLRMWTPEHGEKALSEKLGVPLQQLTGFSKGLLGTALLHRNLAQPLPAWMAAEDEGAAIAPTPSLLAARPKEERVSPQPPRAAAAVPRQATPTVRLTSAPAGIGSVSWLRTMFARCTCQTGTAQALRVDAKTPLASERSLLRWLRSSVLLSSLSAYLCSRADDASQLNGVLLGGAAMLFVLWPLSNFRRRSLEYRQAYAGMGQPKVDRTLPQALAMLLVVILLATLLIHSLFGNAVTVTSSG